MDNQQILSHVDHTLLSASAVWSDIRTLCEEAIVYKTASVCVPPAYVGRIRDAYGGRLTICTVVGFPLGYQVTDAKLAETQQAVRDGAGEVDMVINLGDVKDGAYEKVTAEITALKQEVGTGVLKVIVETCYLTEEEKIAVCRCVSEGRADYIKTSTGFGTGGATLADVMLFKENIAPGIKIKAAGGIRTREDMEAYLEAGCERLGTSSAIKLLTGGQAIGY